MLRIKGINICRRLSEVSAEWQAHPNVGFCYLSALQSGYLATHMQLNHPRVGALYYSIKQIFRGDLLPELVYRFLNQIPIKVRVSVISR